MTKDGLISWIVYKATVKNVKLTIVSGLSLRSSKENLKPPCTSSNEDENELYEPDYNKDEDQLAEEQES